MKRREQIVDELLVLRSQGGDRAAFERLAMRWQPRHLRLARRLTRSGEAGEVVQEAWLAIVRGLPRLADPARFGTWSYRIVARKSTDWIRRRQRDRSLSDRMAREPRPQSENEVEAGVAQREGVTRLRRALTALSRDHRRVLELFYLRSLSVAVIAQRLDLSPGTVKSRLFHARQSLRQAMEESS